MAAAFERKRTLADLERIAKQDVAMFEALVWYARSSSDAPHIVALRRKVEREFPEETGALAGEASDWTHGFNSGMLAAMRKVVGVLTAAQTAHAMNADAEDGSVPMARKDAVAAAEGDVPDLGT